MKAARILASGIWLLALILPAQQIPFHFFDPDHLVDIQGTVQRVDLEETYGKKSKFLVLTVESEERGLCRVEVCPQWFMDNDIAPGMKVRIRASLLAEGEGLPYLITQEISIHGERIVLRDIRGFPLWSQHGSPDGGGGRRGSGRHGRR